MVLTLLAALAAAAGCGVKAPPVAPQQPPMPQINDLSGMRDDSRMMLTWTHPAGQPAVAGYAVLQLKTEIGATRCPGCPQTYEQIGTVLVPAGRQSTPERLNFTQPLEDGFNYTFIVRPYQSSGARGPDSNPVAVRTGGPS